MQVVVQRRAGRVEPGPQRNGEGPASRFQGLLTDEGAAGELDSLITCRFHAFVKTGSDAGQQSRAEGGAFDPLTLGAATARDAKFGRSYGYAGPWNRASGEAAEKYIIVDMFARAARGEDPAEVAAWGQQELENVYGG